MSKSQLERRQDRRTAAYVPITFRAQGEGPAKPAHLIDLSLGGAGLLTTSNNAPVIGQHLELFFETLTNNEDDESRTRREAAVVINLREPERGVTRIGLRFIQNRGFGASLFDPLHTLSDHRRTSPAPNPAAADRWKTARNFDRHSATLAAGAL